MSNRIGRYELRSRLGSGAFATVHEAFDPRLESVVAIKLLADNWIHVPEVRARFRQEAVLLRRVQTSHPTAPLIDVYDIDEGEDGRPYFVMRLADRGSLEERSAHGQTWSAAAVLPLIDVLEDALGTLHRAGIVHRDVKPSNVMITSIGDSTANKPTEHGAVGEALLAPDERVLLGDLGLAKDMLTSGSALTMAGGTPRFMAPEQRDPAAAIDHRADLYAATAVVADLITGSPSVPEVRGGPSDAARVHFATGMAEDPSLRHGDARLWAAAMREALMTLATSTSTSPSTPTMRVSPPIRPTVAAATPASPPDAAVPTAPVPPSSRRWLVPAARTRLGLVGAAALVTALLASLAVLVLRGDSPIDGPRDVTVGETVTLSADVDPGDRYVWTVGGRQVSDQALELLPDREGFVRVELEVVAADGTTTRSTARITVTE